MIQDIRQIKQTYGCSGNFEIATWHVVHAHVLQTRDICTQSRLVYANTCNLYVHLHNPVQTAAAVGTARALPW